MKFGIFGINIGRFALDHRMASDAARAAEEAGWESAWVGEHYVLPDPQTPASPAPPGTPFLDPWQALVNIAVQTDRILVGTGVTVIPYHEPVALAKKVASLDQISEGRFLFGIGVGYLPPEFAALGVSLGERGVTTDQALNVLREIWSNDRVDVGFRGRRIAGVGAHPRPRRPEGPPIVVGGSGRAAWLRAARVGDGYYGWLMDPKQARSAVDGLRTAEREVEHRAGRPPLEVSVTPPARLTVTRDVVDAYASTGVSRLILIPPTYDDPDRLMKFIDEPSWLRGSGKLSGSAR